MRQIIGTRVAMSSAWSTSSADVGLARQRRLAGGDRDHRRAAISACVDARKQFGDRPVLQMNTATSPGRSRSAASVAGAASV